MSKPKALKESADAKASRLAEEERIRVMQSRAQADEAAAGRQLLTRKTRMTMRLFGARMGMAGTSGVGNSVPILGGSATGLGGNAPNVTLAALGGGSHGFATSNSSGAFLGGGWAR